MENTNMTNNPLVIINPGNGLPGISPCTAVPANPGPGGGGGGGCSTLDPCPPHHPLPGFDF